MYYIFVNPSARSGKGITIWNKTEAYLKEHHIEYEAHYTKKDVSPRPEFEAILAKEERDSIPVIVIGGDGTLNQCINGIPEPDRFELSYLPAGSGNDFGRSKTFPSTLSERLDSILNRRNETTIDIGMVEASAHNGQTACRRFLVSSGLGYDAEICHVVNRSRLKDRLNKIHLGKIIYLMVGLKNIFATKACDMEVTVNGQTTTYPGVFFVASMNQPYEGGGIPMAPNAADNDGILSFLIVYGMSHLKALTMIPFIATAKHAGRRGIALTEGTEITVKMSLPKIVHSDGECFGAYDSYHVTLDKKIRFIY
ncbi:MAG: diacylglycerol/lipid kinase family protein [Lachnospiraceae bacterium]